MLSALNSPLKGFLSALLQMPTVLTACFVATEGDSLFLCLYLHPREGACYISQLIVLNGEGDITSWLMLRYVSTLHVLSFQRVG